MMIDKIQSLMKGVLRWIPLRDEIVLESDCRVFRLVLDGREDARVELPPLK